MEVDNIKSTSTNMKQCNSLARISKKANIPVLETMHKFKSCADLSKKSVKKTLGRLFPDKEYLEHLKQDLGKKSEFTDLKIAEIADSGLQFLDERSEYWDTLGPLPPLMVKPKKKRHGMRKDGYRVSSDSFNTNTTSTTNTSCTTANKSIRRRRKVKEVDPNELLHFKFESLRPTTKQYGHLEVQDTHQDERPFSFCKRKLLDDEAKHKKAVESRKLEIVNYLEETLKLVLKEFDNEYFASCEQYIADCFKYLDLFDESDYSDRMNQIKYKLYTVLGNIHVEKERLPQAMEYFHKALNIQNSTEDEFVSLGNIGRVLLIQCRYNEALETITRQMGLASSDSDSAKVLTQLGNCFISLKQYSYAKHCARKSLRSSRRAADKVLEAEASILLAVTLGYMNQPKEANKILSKAERIVIETGNRTVKKRFESAERTIASILKPATNEDKKKKLPQKSFLPKLNLSGRLISTPA